MNRGGGGGGGGVTPQVLHRPPLATPLAEIQQFNTDNRQSDYK